MKAIIALSFAAVAVAAPDNCQEANAYAQKFFGNCDAVSACFDDFTANAAWANDAFANTGFSNDGFESNSGFSNEGFLGNAGSSNDGFVANEGFNGNINFELNDGFANEGFVSVFCQDLFNCGAFETAFANCFPTPLPTPSVTEEIMVCEEVFLGDGVCDDICNTEEFLYDNGDCVAPTSTETETATSTETATETVMEVVETTTTDAATETTEM